MVNQFLHQVYLKYKYREYRQLKKGKSLERIIFICKFIGRFKLLAWRTKCRVVAKKIMFRIKRYLQNFRERRKIRLERDVLQSIQNFKQITKIYQAGRILIEKVLKIQINWRIFLGKKDFSSFINLLKWQRNEKELMDSYKAGETRTDLFDL